MVTLSLDLPYKKKRRGRGVETGGRCRRDLRLLKSLGLADARSPNISHRRRTGWLSGSRKTECSVPIRSPSVVAASNRSRRAP